MKRSRISSAESTTLISPTFANWIYQGCALSPQYVYHSTEDFKRSTITIFRSIETINNRLSRFRSSQRDVVLGFPDLGRQWFERVCVCVYIYQSSGIVMVTP